MTEEELAELEEPQLEPIARGGCWWRLGTVLLLALMLFYLLADYIYNIRSNSNYLAFRDSLAPLKAQLADGSWKQVSTLTVRELDRALVTQFSKKGTSWRQLIVRRDAKTVAQRAAQLLYDAEVNVIELSPEYYSFSTSFQDRFALTTARERLNRDGVAFAINCNFREPDGKPLGLVVHEGVEVNRHFPKWTGYFFVKAGRPLFGPKSLLDETPGVLQEAAQVYPSLMRDHTVFPYVTMAPDLKFDGNRITYRSLAGVRQDGTVVFIASGDGGIMNVAEVAALALKLNVQHATLLDGGRALQYGLEVPGCSFHFHAFNTQLDVKWKGWEAERSPVFIVAKPVQP